MNLINEKHWSICLSLCNRYDESPIEHKPYRQKDGALLAIGSLCDKLKQTEPYKSELERMLVQHVLPEFASPIGHLRAKVVFFFFCLVISVLDIHYVFIKSLWVFLLELKIQLLLLMNASRGLLIIVCI